MWLENTAECRTDALRNSSMFVTPNAAVNAKVSATSNAAVQVPEDTEQSRASYAACVLGFLSNLAHTSSWKAILYCS